MTTLIADIGNCHFGSFNKAKELIYEAKQNGADIVKGQAFNNVNDIKGSMPIEFYKSCQFSQLQYLELIEYAESIGIPMFFSIFSSGLDLVFLKQKYCKLAACQTEKMTLSEIELCDYPYYFISLSREKMISQPIILKNATVLYPSKYLAIEPKLYHLQEYKLMYDNFGYSDHTAGIDNCIKASKIYKVQTIEKHFCLSKNISFNGEVFRDTIHGITPKELYDLARGLK